MTLIKGAFDYDASFPQGRRQSVTLRQQLDNAKVIHVRDFAGVGTIGKGQNADQAVADAVGQILDDYAAGDVGSVANPGGHFLRFGRGHFVLTQPLAQFTGGGRVGILGQGMEETIIKFNPTTVTVNVATRACTGASAGAFGTAGSNATQGYIEDTTATWTPNAYVGQTVEVMAGTGVGGKRVIITNTATRLYVDPWITAPVAGSTFRVYEGLILFDFQPSGLTDKIYRTHIRGFTVTSDNASTQSPCALRVTSVRQLLLSNVRIAMGGQEQANVASTAFWSRGHDESRLYHCDFTAARPIRYSFNPSVLVGAGGWDQWRFKDLTLYSPSYNSAWDGTTALMEIEATAGGFTSCDWDGLTLVGGQGAMRCRGTAGGFTSSTMKVGRWENAGLAQNIGPAFDLIGGIDGGLAMTQISVSAIDITVGPSNYFQTAVRVRRMSQFKWDGGFVAASHANPLDIDNTVGTATLGNVKWQGVGVIANGTGALQIPLVFASGPTGISRGHALMIYAADFIPARNTAAPLTIGPRAATGTSATSLTDTVGAAQTTNALVGHYVRVDMGLPTEQSARINANTTNSYTVTGWPGGTPSSTCQYQVEMSDTTNLWEQRYKGRYWNGTLLLKASSYTPLVLAIDTVNVPCMRIHAWWNKPGAAPQPAQSGTWSLTPYGADNIGSLESGTADAAATPTANKISFQQHPAVAAPLGFDVYNGFGVDIEVSLEIMWMPVGGTA